MMRVAFQCILGSSCIALFDYAAKHEHEPRWLWAGASAALWLFCWQYLGGGVALVLAGQAVLFVVMTVRLVKKKRDIHVYK